MQEIEAIGASPPRLLPVDPGHLRDQETASDGGAGTFAAELRRTRAEDIASSLLTQDEVDAVCKKYGIPEEFTAIPAGKLRACTEPPPGAVCVYVDALEGGMCLPLQSFFREVLLHFGLAPSQIAPNGWRIMAAFVDLSHDVGVPPSLNVFRHLFSPSRISGSGKYLCWYFFRSKGSSNSLLISLSSTAYKNRNWKEGFFFLSSKKRWPCPVRWGKAKIFRDPRLTSEEESLKALLRARSDTSSPSTLPEKKRKRKLMDAYAKEGASHGSSLSDARPPPCITADVESDGHDGDSADSEGARQGNVAPSRERTDMVASCNEAIKVCSICSCAMQASKEFEEKMKAAANQKASEVLELRGSMDKLIARERAAAAEVASLREQLDITKAAAEAEVDRMKAAAVLERIKRDRQAAELMDRLKKVNDERAQEKAELDRAKADVDKLTSTKAAAERAAAALRIELAKKKAELVSMERAREIVMETMLQSADGQET